MTIRSSPCSAFMRRALARASSTVRAARIVDVDGRLGEPAGRVGHARPVPRVEIARAHLVRVDLGLGAEQALHELLLGHLEAQHQHLLVVFDAARAWRY